MKRRHFLQSGAAATLAITTSRAVGQPSGTVTIWSGFPAGGLGDQVTRPLLDQIRQRSPLHFVYDSKPGAGGRIAAEFVRRAPPDGRNVLQSPSSVIVLHPHVFKQLPYDTLADFVPVAGLCTYTAVLTAGPALPAEIRTVQAFLDWARANPAQANYGVPALGSSLHLAGALLSQQSGVRLNTVPYKGGGPLLVDLLGGHVPVSFNVVSEVLPHIREGKLRALAVTAPQRWRALPDVPALTELGYADIAFLDWLGWYGPAGMPSAQVAHLNQIVDQGLATPAMAEVLQRIGLEPMRMSPEIVRAQVERDHAFWARVVKLTGFKPED